MEAWPCALLVGFGVSLGVGTLVTWLYHSFIHRKADEALKKVEGDIMPDADKATHWGITSVLAGIVERAAFTLLVIAQPGTALTVMGGWLALKLATGWQMPEPDKVSRLRCLTHASVGLQAGFLSLAFAVLGGGIARLMMELHVIQGWPFEPWPIYR